MGTTEWANEYRYLAKQSSAKPGKYSADLTPHIAGIHAAMDDPNVQEVWVRKPAQAAWTDGALINYILKRVHLAPTVIIGLFPKTADATDFSQLKFKAAVEVTPVVAELVDLSGSRKSGNRNDLWNFPGGFLRLVTSRSTGSVKSFPAEILFCEEPDDLETDLKGQGTAIDLLRERRKTYGRRGKLFAGGTPTIAGLSVIDDQYEKASDRRIWLTPCSNCKEAHELLWAWGETIVCEETRFKHAVYGKYRPDTARYRCPACGALWDNVRKNQNVRRGDWHAQGTFEGIAGFAFSELILPWEESRLEKLAALYLAAQAEFDQGKEEKLIAWTNNQEGRAYEHPTDTPEAEELQARAERYLEGVVPDGGLALFVGIDVQHHYFSVNVEAFGPGEESWLVWCGELPGNVQDRSDPVWAELEKRLWTPVRHACGGHLIPTAVSIDCSDGKTNDNVYAWVRDQRRRRLPVLAVKGDSWDGRSGNADRQVYSTPKPIDVNGGTKAARYGLQVYIVGTQQAKSTISARLALKGSGPGRMHFYDAGIRYFEQVTAEVYAPSRRHRGRKMWQVRAGRENHFLDCKVYTLHAAYHAGVHRWPQARWEALRRELMQPTLFEATGTDVPQPPSPATGSGNTLADIGRRLNG